MNTDVPRRSVKCWTGTRIDILRLSFSRRTLTYMASFTTFLFVLCFNFTIPWEETRHVSAISYIFSLSDFYIYRIEPCRGDAMCFMWGTNWMDTYVQKKCSLQTAVQKWDTIPPSYPWRYDWATVSLRDISTWIWLWVPHGSAWGMNALKIAGSSSR
jgi:hypothetical protein